MLLQRFGCILNMELFFQLSTLSSFKIDLLYFLLVIFEIGSPTSYSYVQSIWLLFRQYILYLLASLSALFYIYLEQFPFLCGPYHILLSYCTHLCAVMFYHLSENQHFRTSTVKIIHCDVLMAFHIIVFFDWLTETPGRKEIWI